MRGDLKLNILFLTYQGDIAGSTNSIAFLCKGLADKGHNIYLGCRKESLIFSMLQNTRVNLISMVFKNKFDLANIKHIKKIVKDHQIDIINAQSSKDRYNVIWAKWIYNLNVKIIHTRRQRPRSIGGFLQNTFYTKGTDKIVVISDELKNQFIELGIPANHLKVIYNGTPAQRYSQIDLSQINKLRESYQITKNDIVIGSISRIKNQDQIIKALKYLDDNIKLLLAGVPVGYYDKLIKEQNIKNKVIYAGTVDFDQVLLYYKLLNVNILASTMDGFGLVITEAMAMGTPVIGTNYGGIKNIISHGENGLLFEDKNIEELAQMIQKALDDKMLREKLIKNGKETALKKFSIENTINNYEAFFLSLINEP